MKQITLIRQRNDTDCGIACVAMLACVSYETAKEALFRQMRWTARRSQFWTTANALYNLSEAFGLKTEICQYKGWDEIQGCAVVGVNPTDGYFHWVVTIKTPRVFLILDPELGDVYQGDEWAIDNVRELDEEEDSENYYVGRRHSYYLSFPGLTFSGIQL